MSKKEKNLQEIYLNQMVEVRDRIHAAEFFINSFLDTKNNIEFDCGVLQFRKALEATAYASISPNKEAYKKFRLKAEKNKDFTTDFNAREIFKNLEKINQNFYPLPLIPAVQQNDGTWQFGRKENGFLTKKRFVKIYDRLGKFLHADNPWDNNKHRPNLAKDIQTSIPQIRELLLLHGTFIRAKNHSEAWFVEVPLNEDKPKIISAIAKGDFAVK